MSGFWEQGLYQASRDVGFWSPATAGANFCEEDYLITYYVAEFINTLSNLAYVYYALYPPSLSLRHVKNRQRSKFDVHTLTLLCIGLTSAVFHGTMRSLPQLMDETSMYLLIAGFTFELLTTRYTIADFAQRSLTSSKKPFYVEYQEILKLLAIQSIITTGISFSSLNLATHELIMASLVSICLLRVGSFGLEVLLPRSTSSQGSQDSSIAYTALENHHRGLVGSIIVLTLMGTTTFTILSGDLSVHSVTFMLFVLICGWNASNMIRKHDSKTKSELYWHLLSAYLTLNVAFGLWLIDCSPSWCAILRQVRHELVAALPNELGTLVGFVTELHGWWHIGTARAAAEFINLIRFVTLNVPRKDEKEIKKS